MLLDNIKIPELPSVCLLDKDRLPIHAAIYFVSDSKGKVIYIGRTNNLLKRWKEHHRFKQLKKLNKKDPLSISWINFSNNISSLSKIENELINLYKPPLNWTRLLLPIKKITPQETALQQSLKQLAKFNTMVLGFNPISDVDPPTIYLVYPVYGNRGISGSIRSSLSNINDKCSTLKWQEYHTEPKSLGKFGFWKTIYKNIMIDISPFDGLVHFMGNNYKTIAGIELMAFTDEQLEVLAENTSQSFDKISFLENLENDPIPIKSSDKIRIEQEYSNNFQKEQEELEIMSEGKAKVMNR